MKHFYKSMFIKILVYCINFFCMLISNVVPVSAAITPVPDEDGFAYIGPADLADSAYNDAGYATINANYTGRSVNSSGAATYQMQRMSAPFEIDNVLSITVKGSISGSDYAGRVGSINFYLVNSITGESSKMEMNSAFDVTDLTGQYSIKWDGTAFYYNGRASTVSFSKALLSIRKSPSFYSNNPDSNLTLVGKSQKICALIAILTIKTHVQSAFI